MMLTPAATATNTTAVTADMNTVRSISAARIYNMYFSRDQGSMIDRIIENQGVIMMLL